MYAVYLEHGNSGHIVINMTRIPEILKPQVSDLIKTFENKYDMEEYDSDVIKEINHTISELIKNNK